MASLINPKCGLPTYLLDNSADAAECGKLNGQLLAGILIVITLITSIWLYWESKQNYTFNKTLIHFGITFLIVCALWIVLPFLSVALSKISWDIKQEEIKGYMSKGFDKQGAIKQVQDMHEAVIQADATANAAFTIANALRPMDSNRIRY